MSRHDDRITMRQMLDNARQARAMAHGRKRSDLDSDSMFRLALTHLVEIIGEAASRRNFVYHRLIARGEGVKIPADDLARHLHHLEFAQYLLLAVGKPQQPTLVVIITSGKRNAASR